jgi:hypothetical protein
MSTRAGDVFQRIGDALAGVDPNAQYLQGRKLGAEEQYIEAGTGERKSQTEAAMELARQRRVENEIKENQKAANDRLEQARIAAAADPNFDPSKINIFDLIGAHAGAEYSGAMEGRNKGQQFDERAVVGTPAGQPQPLGTGGIGDAVVTEAMRAANEDALNPGSAIASRRGGGPPITAQDPDDPTKSIYLPPRGGQPVSVTTPGGSKTARPAPKPATPKPETPSNQEKRTRELEARGVPEERALEIVNYHGANAQSTYSGIKSRLLQGGFYSDKEASDLARSITEETYGAGALEAAQAPILDDTGGDDIPEGTVIVNHKTGARMKLVNGQWQTVK